MRVCAALVLSVSMLINCGGGTVYRDTTVEMTTVSALDTTEYLGKWYEVARFPNQFEEGCVGVTAEYALRDDGDISVLDIAVVGAPKGTTGWILARKPRLSDAEKDWALNVLSDNGYDLDALVWPKQWPVE